MSRARVVSEHTVPKTVANKALTFDSLHYTTISNKSWKLELEAQIKTNTKSPLVKLQTVPSY